MASRVSFGRMHGHIPSFFNVMLYKFNEFNQATCIYNPRHTHTSNKQ